MVRSTLNDRSLTWDKLTPASKIMIPIYVGFFTVIALTWITSNKSILLKSPGLAYADQAVDIRGWGFLFGMVSLIMIWALAVRNRTFFRYALVLAAICMAIWTVLMIAAAIGGDASAAAWSWPATITGACVASNESLLKGEE